MHAAYILQTYLDVVSQAVLAADWETYCDGIFLPCHITSHNETKVVSTVEDLKMGFEQFCDTLRAQRVTDYIRLVESATQLDPHLVSGRYVTHLLAGSQRIMQPFGSDVTLRRVDNRWRAASVANDLTNSRWPLVRLEINPDTPPKGTRE